MKKAFENLYIHVPFCQGKCDYCAFYSEPVPEDDAMRAWFAKIRGSLRQCADNPVPFHTVYFGGGTPTILPADLLTDLFAEIRRLPLAADAELSMEANPFTITPEKADILAANVNRMSLGVQSFQAKTLRALGRRQHAGADAAEAVRRLRAAGLRNIGLDLIYGAPGQTADEWRTDLQTALALAPQHISAYCVIPEDGTPYAERNRGIREDDELQYTLWDLCGKILGSNGLYRYEISNFAVRGFESRHNSNVWHGETYLGLGPSAVSFDGEDRSMEVADLRRWLDGAPAAIDHISAESRAAEMLMMGLRTTRGWGRGEFRAASGLDWDFLKAELTALQEDGLITLTGERLTPTERGLLYWNVIGEAIVRL